MELHVIIYRIIFDLQEIFTCTRADESIDCADSPRFYNLNAGFGDLQENENHVTDEMELNVENSPAALGEPSQHLELERKPDMNRRTSKF